MAGRSAIGLDIGTSGVRAAELSFGKGQVTLEKFGQVALPEGAVRDGEVVDPDAVAAAVKQLWAHTKFSSKKVVIGVANQKVIVRQVDLPWMPVDELKKSLAFQVQDFVPMPVDQAVLDFHPLEELTAEGGTRILRGLLVAASRDMVNASLEAVQKAGLSPVMVDLTSFAVIRSLADADHLGLGAQVDAVAERMGVPQEQAEAMKQQLGLGVGGEGADVQAATRVVEAVGAAFVDEVRGSLDYYLASSGSAPISRLVLTGGGARLGGLAQRLQVTTRVPVEVGTPMSTLQVGRTGLSPEQIAFVEPLAAVPVGLALGVAS